MRIRGTTVTIQNTSGYNAMVASNIFRGAAGNYTISFPSHLAGTGSNCIRVVITRTGTDTGNYYYYATCKFITATLTESKVTVHIRSTVTDPALVEGDLFFHAVPQFAFF